MEQGQSVVASSFKRRREQFYENRRSTSDLSSGEIDLVDDAQSTSASHASHVTCTSTTPVGKSLLLGHQTLVTSGKPTGSDEELESTKGTREKGSSAARKTPTKDGDEKGLSKKVKKGSFRMPSFRRKSEAQPPPTPLPTAARAAEASVRQSRGSAIFGRRQAGGDKVQLQHRFRLRRVLSSDHLPSQNDKASKARCGRSGCRTRVHDLGATAVSFLRLDVLISGRGETEWIHLSSEVVLLAASRWTNLYSATILEGTSCDGKPAHVINAFLERLGRPAAATLTQLALLWQIAEELREASGRVPGAQTRTQKRWISWPKCAHKSRYVRVSF
ncbi:uncharacterized protein ACA1_137450 [Acanthamoeba castellanii str. Neff]|uniref:Uncharacterized protein n=1 Tax=Acanthamoeba castellanii (strain ATCC 30010 / Neff) TaxID=1257118 RepID=L8GYL9_ACACF|nr:uncharacterized protein ACA1_137450 [Acanthamoeba castellanii str. Neff]ELR18384.1 hypothetical protein ACA1_137450 [Acanthamoeba castellanii str. Neff]